MLPRILIIDHEIDAVQQTQRALEAEGYQVLTTVTGQAGIVVAEIQRPSLILVEIDLPDIDGYQVCRALRGTPSLAEVPIIMYSARGEVSDKVAGFKAGANDYIVKPAAAAELIARIEAALRSDEQPLAHIVTVWGSKGGVGTTTLASNLALALQSITSGRVTLVDASVLGGTLSVMLNLAPRHTIADLVPRLDDLDSELLASVLARHSSGVKVLLSPAWAMNGDGVQPKHLERILAWLQQASDYVVVDTSPSLDMSTLTVLQLAHQAVVVLTPDMASLCNAKVFLSEVQGWDQAPEELVFVVNRYPVKGGLKLSDIQASLRRTIDAQVPSDESLVTYSINRGIPLVISHRHSPVAKGLFGLAEKLVKDSKKDQRASILSTVLGRRS